MIASLRRDHPHILLINPWIHDFAAYDFWAKPMGLLLLGAILRRSGFKVSYLDCLDRFHPKAKSQDPTARHGRGPYLKTTIDKPRGLEHIPRRFSRYGIQPDWFYADLADLDPPDLILVTSMMTYWYPGVRETIAVVKTVFPTTEVVLGGIYATLCPMHAEKTVGADRVVAGEGVSQIAPILGALGSDLDHGRLPTTNPDTWPRPAFDLQRQINYIPLLTAIGCPYRCDYCASRKINPDFRRRSVESVMEEIRFWHGRHGVLDFVFYDDALLVQADTHAKPLFVEIIRSGIKVHLHTPNGLHIRYIDDRMAHLMHRAGMTTLRLGLETADMHDLGRLDRKVTQIEFHRAVSCLKRTGFKREQIGAYLLAGLPGQSLESVATAIDIVKQSGVAAVLAHYTPIPHTALWKEACQASSYDLEADPIFTNNAIFPCSGKGFSWETYSRLKRQTG